MDIQHRFWMRLFTCWSVFFYLAAVLSAQTAPTQPSESQRHSVLIREKDYAALRIEANRLSSQELASLEAQGRSGDVHAQLVVGMAYQIGCPGATHDLSESLKWYRLAADQGSTMAANQIAIYYDPSERFAGWHGQDAELALSWYRKAAESGQDVVGQLNVGEMLHQMHRDGEAVEWYRKAIENGDSRAAVGLVELYDQGKAVPSKSKHENWREAVEYFQRLADAGNPGAQFVMGQEYREGWLGVHRDLNRAFVLFQKAAAQGWPRAMLAVGDSYFKGMGVTKDRTEAAKWFQLAADQLDPIGIEYMAYIYEHGDGVVKDPVSAYGWYLLARHFGRQFEFRQNLSVDQMDEGEKKMRAFKIAHGLMQY